MARKRKSERVGPWGIAAIEKALEHAIKDGVLHVDHGERLLRKIRLSENATLHYRRVVVTDE